MQVPESNQGIAGIKFPIISDQSHRISRDYGVLIKDEGISLRAVFIIDPAGFIQYSVTHNLNVGRSVDEILRVLAALQSGGLCYSDWKPDEN
jgi:peroxiredoxin (alkyl hydroperoxide reductase subunit C)